MLTEIELIVVGMAIGSKDYRKALKAEGFSAELREIIEAIQGWPDKAAVERSREILKANRVDIAWAESGPVPVIQSAAEKLGAAQAEHRAAVKAAADALIRLRNARTERRATA
jgi:hypothetical protein